MARASIPLYAILFIAGYASAVFPAPSSDVRPAGEIGPATTRAHPETEHGGMASSVGAYPGTALVGAPSVPGAPAHVVIMIDRSGSTQPGGDLRAQLEGYASALEHPKIGETLARLNTRISVIAWSGVNEQRLLIDRSAITGSNSARRLAAEIRALPLAAGGLTDLPSAIAYAIAHLDRVAGRSYCDVIIVATDQFDSAGYIVAGAQENLQHANAVRAMAIERNIIIHGFGLGDPSVATYLRNNIATPGSEVSFVTSNRSFARELARLLRSDFCKALVAFLPSAFGEAS